MSRKTVQKLPSVGAWAGEAPCFHFCCSGCNEPDESVFPKTGVEHWRRGDPTKGEPFELVCGIWEPLLG